MMRQTFFTAILVQYIYQKSLFCLTLEKRKYLESNWLFCFVSGWHRLYYRRVEEGMQYSVLCRRLASLNEEFISNKSPSAGFDFTSGKKIEQKLLDYNKEAERFGGIFSRTCTFCYFCWHSRNSYVFLLTGYAYEELSEVSPDHRYLAYTMYDKDNDHFKLSVRDLNSGSLCNKPQADRVSSIAWAKNGQALLYAVTDDKKRPFRFILLNIRFPYWVFGYKFDVLFSQDLL